MLTRQLTPTPPFDWTASLRFLAGFSPTRDEHVVSDGTLTKAVMLDGDVVGFQVRSLGSVASPLLEVSLDSEDGLTEELADAVLDVIGFFLSVDDDLQPFYAQAADDRAFAPIARALYGYHQVKFLTPYENACWAILSQRTSMEQAHETKLRLVAELGGSVGMGEQWFGAFPSPRAMLARFERAREIVNHVQKIRYLEAATQAFLTVDEGFLRHGPIEEVESWLRAIPGVGAWSATFVLVRGLGRVERIPVGESRLAAAVARRYGREHATPAGIQRIADRYGPWQGYWAHYMRVAG
ncbi:MAG: DNA-3-methyladenine glycosylase 2 family protein [Chloroflexota bacterium]